MAENGPATFSLLVLVIAVLVTIFSIPEVPGVHSSNVHKESPRRHASVNDREVPEISSGFSQRSINYLGRQVNRHLAQSFQYLYMSSFFDHSDLALPGFARFFKEFSDRELDNANFLMTYINKRGGYVQLSDIPAPSFNVVNLDNAATKALKNALDDETDLQKKMHKLHTIATTQNDPHLKHIMEDHYLDKSVQTIKELRDHIARIERFGPANAGLGVYLYDKQI